MVPLSLPVSAIVICTSLDVVENCCGIVPLNWPSMPKCWRKCQSQKSPPNVPLSLFHVASNEVTFLNGGSAPDIVLLVTRNMTNCWFKLIGSVPDKLLECTRTYISWLSVENDSGIIPLIEFPCTLISSKPCGRLVASGIVPSRELCPSSMSIT